MFGRFNTKQGKSDGVAKSPAEQAKLWRDVKGGLIEPVWLFEMHGYAMGSLFATTADTLSRIVLKEIQGATAQECIAALPPLKAKAAIACYAHAFVYRSFAVHYSHKPDIDNDTHQVASSVAKFVHVLVGSPYDATEHIDQAAMKDVTRVGAEDGLEVALSMLSDRRLPQLHLSEALRRVAHM